MATSEYDVPGAGSSNVGYVLRAFFSGGRQITADRVTLSENASEQDLQKIVDALAGIPGATYVAVEEGRVANRSISPDRPYEPLPPPPE